MNKEAKILGVMALVIIAVAAIFAFKKGPTPLTPGVPLDSKNLVRETSHMTGLKTAKVTLVEFGDYQCAACAVAFPTIEQIKDVYQGNPNFNFVFRNFPLTEIHPYAQPAAEAAEASGEQGQYWEMYKMLYVKQKEWIGPQAPTDFVQYAQQLGLDVTKFRQALDEHKFADVVKTDRADGDALKVNSTPTFFLNGEMMVGVPNFSDLKAKIDEKLK